LGEEEDDAEEEEGGFLDEEEDDMEEEEEEELVIPKIRPICSCDDTTEQRERAQRWEGRSRERWLRTKENGRQQSRDRDR